MAGSKLAADILKRYSKDYRVVLIGEESTVGYNRILLSSLLAQELTHEDLALIDVNDLIQKGLLVLTSNPVISVDTHLQQVTLSDFSTLFYDKLVFATGSRSRNLNIDGATANNVIGFRDLSDVSTMTALKARQNVIVIGGGLLGLEAAVGLVKRGHQVTVVHRSAHLLNNQLDATAARMLQRRLESMGIQFQLNSHSLAFRLNNSDTAIANGLELTDGRVLAGDLFVVATGIVPETTIAKRAGIEVNRAILVNASMETSVNHHYAVGECTEFNAMTFGLVAPIWQQIDSLIAHLGQQSKPFKLEPVPTKLKVSGVHLFSAGDIVGSSDASCIYYRDEALQHYRKLVVKEGILVGVLLYGNVEDGPWYTQLMQEKQSLNAFMDELIFGERYCNQRIA